MIFCSAKGAARRSQETRGWECRVIATLKARACNISFFQVSLGIINKIDKRALYGHHTRTFVFNAFCPKGSLSYHGYPYGRVGCAAGVAG